MIGALPEPADGRTARTPRLAELGFPGLDALDIPVLVALSLGDPALLLGSPGSSRSAVVEALATELALRPVVVDVSADASRARLVRAVDAPEANTVEQPAFLLLHGLERVGPERYSWVGEVLRHRRPQPRDSIHSAKPIFRLGWHRVRVWDGVHDAPARDNATMARARHRPSAVGPADPGVRCTPRREREDARLVAHEVGARAHIPNFR